MSLAAGETAYGIATGNLFVSHISPVDQLMQRIRCFLESETELRPAKTTSVFRYDPSLDFYGNSKNVNLLYLVWLVDEARSGKCFLHFH